MRKEFIQNNYHPGDIVYARVNPSTKLVIRRYIDRIYYCQVQEFPERKDLVYFEREFVPDPGLIAKNKKR
ncbi:hypothetical protein FKX85_20555 [Echinicola soli]|uniref:Uncharacterized protein n=1 Tax=Echinicola soli TaxID=2591634 RepID=A0A514CNB1_9BACT|nr:hypothetical protein [Echinicola soli]QDH81291.1 hypothetical protein FKX85_20555 [Echinicola soli]